jgi:hypothetical protein
MNVAVEEGLLELWTWRDRAETPRELVRLLDRLKQDMDEAEEEATDAAWDGDAEPEGEE